MLSNEAQILMKVFLSYQETLGKKFLCPLKQIITDTNLSRYAIDKARYELLGKGILSESFSGIPRQKFYQLLLPADLLIAADNKYEEDYQCLLIAADNKAASKPTADNKYKADHVMNDTYAFSPVISHRNNLEVLRNKALKSEKESFSGNSESLAQKLLLREEYKKEEEDIREDIREEIHQPTLFETEPKKQSLKTFHITSGMREWARSNTPYIDIEAETEKFRDYYLARSSKIVDWTRAWYNWMRKATEFQSKRININPLKTKKVVI